MLELALRSTLILAAAWALTRVLPRATAATRHLVWHVALTAVVLAPVIAPIAPRFEVALAPLAQAPQAPDVPQVAQAVVPRADAVLSGTEVTFGTSTFGRVAALSTLGTLATALWFLSGWVASFRLSQRARPAPVAWQVELNALCERLRIMRAVKLGIIDEPSSPLATGLFRPAILLPEAAAEWSPDCRRTVLLHELAHIQRRDCRVQLIAQAACALYWFNPLVWMAATALRSERERACDDQVLRLGAQASSYATHLLDIAGELRTSMRPSAALAMARPSELEGRLLSVLAAGRARVPARGTRWAVVTTLTLATGAALGATPARDAKIVFPGDRADAAPSYVVANDVLMSAAPTPTPRSRAEAILQSSADAEDREDATLALAFSSGRDVIPALLQALTDSDADVREKAAVGLTLRRDARIVEPLIGAMDDADSRVREKVVIALGASGDLRARDALTRALGDGNAQVREKAVAALVLLDFTH